MPNYRRLRAPGGPHFFTLRLRRRDSDLLVREIDRLRAAFAETRALRPFALEAVTVLPDHLHAVMRLPPGDADFPDRWRRIRSAFSRSLPDEPALPGDRLRPGERGLWQRRYWEHLIRDRADLDLHRAYCWADPVAHGLVARAADWPHGSFRRELARGRVAADWAWAPTFRAE